MAFNVNDLKFEYDAGRRICIVSADTIVHATSQGDCLRVISAIHDYVTQLLGGKKGYLILDYGKIWIEPENITEYAEELYKELDEHIYKDGYARYGLGIGRVTSKRISKYMEDNSPLPLFYTREEAIDYIHRLIADKKPAESIKTPVRVPE